MKVVNICPCCSDRMLHHFHGKQEYWFCRKCWQEMPVLPEENTKNKLVSNRILSLSPNLLTHGKLITV